MDSFLIFSHADLSGNFDIESRSNHKIYGISYLTVSSDIPLTHRILDPHLGGGALLDL